MGDHEYDQYIGEKETRDGYQEIGQKCGAAIIYSASENGGTDPNRKRECPGQDGSHDKKGKAVQKTLPDLFECRLVVFPGNGLPREKVTIEVKVLDVEGLIQMEFLPESFHHLRSELGIQGVHLARLTRRQVDDEEGNHRNEKQCDDFLYNASSYK
jgi:hypothetical protein